MGSPASERQPGQLAGLLRWLGVGPFVLVLLLEVGQAGIASARVPNSADTRSRLKGDYSPWEVAVIRRVNPAILPVISRDLAYFSESDGSVPEVSEGEFWETATSLPSSNPASPTSIPTMPPDATATLPTDPSSTTIPTVTQPALPGASATPTLPGTPVLLSPTPTRTWLPSPTPTPLPTSVPSSAPMPSSTAVPSGGVLVLNVSSPSDDVNEDQGSFEDSYDSVWLGNGFALNDSWTGLRFTGVAIPRGATIESAILQAAPYEDTWIAVRFTIQAEAAGNCDTYSYGSPPSHRPLTGESVLHDSNRPWQADAYYRLGNITAAVQTVVNRDDWKAGNSLCLILRGDGARWGRKFVYSFEGKPALAPRLLIDYSYGVAAAP